MASRGSSPTQASNYKKRGHHVEKLFAQEIWLQNEYRNDRKAKKDVIDLSGDAHSVKSGSVKWQIFLYSRKRFVDDDGFQALNGIGTLLVHCIDAFPPRFADYQRDKQAAKERLKTPMRDIKDRLQRKALFRAFLNKSIFNSGEVNYLSVLYDDQFHIFRNSDVVELLAKELVVEFNSTEQKVVFKRDDEIYGELEMRNDSVQHYQEVRFNMLVRKIMPLLIGQIKPDAISEISENIVVYGRAIKTFGNWPKVLQTLPKANMENKLAKINKKYP